jgi:hypothetical protein
MSLFLESIYDTDFKQDYRPSVRDGCFTMVNGTTATINCDSTAYNARLELSADFMSAGSQVEVAKVTGWSEYSGINAKYITESGVFDVGLALQEFARSSVERRVVKEDTLAILGRYNMTDSHEMFLYNMLISWMKADMYKSSKGKDKKLRIKVTPYEDSHCTYDYVGCGDGATYEVDLGPPVDEDDFLSQAWTLREKDNYWDKPYVLHYNRGSRQQESFYLVHAMGRTKHDQLNFSLPLDGLDPEDLLLDPVNGTSTIGVALDDIPWERADTIWAWIMDYVSINRLHQPFAACLETLGALAFQPKWSTLEACQWQDAVIKVVLAEFTPTRARIRSALEGEAYLPSATGREMVLKEGIAPTHYIAVSSVMNYQMWYGYYTMMHNAGVVRDDWSTVFGSMEDELQALKTPHARAAAISVITGKQVTTCMTHGCGMYIETAGMINNRVLFGIKSKDGSVGESVAIRNLHAPVSGCLLAGTLVNEFETTCHLTALQHLGRPEDGEGLSFEHSLQLANAYRLFGNETEFENIRTGKRIKPWAAVRELVIEPASLDFVVGRRTRYVPIRNWEREGRSYTVPNVRQLSFDAKCVMMIRRPMLTICDFGSRRKVTSAYVTRDVRPKRQVTIQVNAAYTYVRGAFTAKPVVTELSKQGFGAGNTEATPIAPAPLPPTAAEVVPVTAESLGATDVVTST